MLPRSRLVGLVPFVLLLGAGSSGFPPGTPCEPRLSAGDALAGRDALAAGHALPGVVFVVDGEIVEGPVLADPPDRIERVEVVCPDIAASWLDLEVATVAVLIHTRRGPAHASRSSLGELVKAQEKYRDRHGGYTDDLLALSPYAPPPDVFVYLELTGDGWTARTALQDRHQACFVWVGTPPAAWTWLRERSEVDGDDGEPLCL